MKTNNDVDVAWDYHNGTKHPNGKLFNRFHFYDPIFRSEPYKIYHDIDTISLPLDKSSIGVAGLKAISEMVKVDDKNNVPDLSTLARILYFSGGITKVLTFPGLGEVEFRAAACTGALYHIEIYVVCSDIKGLEAGIYHFEPEQMKLGILRKGDFRSVLAEATADEYAIKHAPVILVYSDIFTRNSMKYQAREYRHAFWDCGTIIANTLAISTAHRLPSKVVMGFVDEKINSLLDLNTEKEVTLALVPIGFSKDYAKKVVNLNPLSIVTEPLSNYNYDDPEIQKIHSASSLNSEDEVKRWKRQFSIKQKIFSPKKFVKLEPKPKNAVLKNFVDSIIIKRGSTREFSHDLITFKELSTIIYYSTRGISADFLEPFGTSLIDLYLIANAVDGLDSGSYVYNKKQNGVELLKKGKFREVAGHLGLDQELPRDGSACVFFITDLNRVFEKFGNRGYRVAQLEASTMGGKFYLAGYGQGLGVTGLTFYDDEVTEFFSPHAENKSVMFMVVIGKKAKKKRLLFTNFKKNQIFG